MTENKKKIVLVNRCGRMGNRLVLFANFAALAEELGCTIVNCPFHSYAQSFVNTRRDIYCRYPASSRKSIWDRIPGASGIIRGTRIFFHGTRALSSLIERLDIGKNTIFTLREEKGLPVIISLESPEIIDAIGRADIVFANGWKFRAPNLVKKHAERIRSYFRPIPGIEEVARHAVEELRQDADIVVAVHMRRGDYRRWQQGRYFFSKDRYAQWMQQMEKLFPQKRVAFLLCSDEAFSRDDFPGLSVRPGPGTPTEDMHAMAECDWIFGPLSTFSQWASFYGATPLFHLRDKDDQLELQKFQVSNLHEVPGTPLPEDACSGL